MKFSYTVLENGLDFVLEAIKNLLEIDEEPTDDKANKRLIKYSLLHLSSGVELVFKHRLLHEHWTYVFSNMNKANRKELESGDFASVDSKTIIERLENFCNIEFIKDKERDEKEDLRILREKRNIAEHFGLVDEIMIIKSRIHKCINVLIRIINTYYNRDNFSAEEGALFSQIGFLLQKPQQHYDAAIAIAKKELEHSNQEDEVFLCPLCEEEFLLIDDTDGVRCLFCGYKATGEEAAKDFISNIIGISEYESVKNGEAFPLYDCPICEEETFAIEWADMAICFSCGYNEIAMDFDLCANCGKPFLITGDEVTICPTCVDDMLEEDDDD